MNSIFNGKMIIIEICTYQRKSYIQMLAILPNSFYEYICTSWWQLEQVQLRKNCWKLMLEKPEYAGHVGIW
jgi:hypothetical protein